VSRSQ